MTAKITNEIREAISAGRGQPVCVEDEQTNKVYVLVDQETHQRAMQALKQQEDMAAIQEGIEQMEAGLGQPVDEADADIRKDLGFPSRQ